MTRPNIRGMGDVMQLSSINTKGTLGDAEVALIARVFDHFTDCLIDWNVTKNSQPVPATVSGVASLSDLFILTIILVWVETLTGYGIDPGTIPMSSPS